MEFTGLAETLWIPLRGRAQAASWHPTFRDPWAEKFVADFDRQSPIKASQRLFSVTRAHAIDQWAGAYLANRPDVTFVQLGAGLCSRYERLVFKGPALEVDLPAVIAEKSRLFSHRSQCQWIAGSAFDANWLNEVKGPSLVIAEGLFHYFDADQVLDLLRAMARHPHPIRLIFDAYSPWVIRSPGARARTRSGSARLRWGAPSASEFAKLVPGMTLVRDRSLLRLAEAKPFSWRLLANLPGISRSYRLLEADFGRI